MKIRNSFYIDNSGERTFCALFILSIFFIIQIMVQESDPMADVLGCKQRPIQKRIRI